MIGKATPRPTTGTRQNATTHHKQLIARIVPRPELAPDYVALAALLHHPDLASPNVTQLHPGDWMIPLHQIIARIALSHLRTIGRADLQQLGDVLADARTVSPHKLTIELATLRRVQELILDWRIVADAVAALTAARKHRQRATA